jgi:hypothetical protein
MADIQIRSAYITHPKDDYVDKILWIVVSPLETMA